MFKTGCILLCSLAILVSGIEDITTLPNTTVTASSSTSQKPTTPVTTVVPTTPSPSPTVTPTQPPTPVTPVTPDTGKWIVNGTNVTCIIAKMALQFNISYIEENNKTESRLLNLPATNETWSNGTCGDLEQNLTIWWDSSIKSNQMNVLDLHFSRNVTSKRWALHHLEVEFASEEFPGIKENSSTKFFHYSDVFSTEVGNSYRCLKNQQLNLTTADNATGSEIFISNLQFQAFNVKDTTAFGYAEDCAFDTPDIVPIAVGCALAILVVIVLAAYLVGRRRSQARGYLSM